MTHCGGCIVIIGTDHIVYYQENKSLSSTLSNLDIAYNHNVISIFNENASKLLYLIKNDKSSSSFYTIMIPTNNRNEVWSLCSLNRNNLIISLIYSNYNNDSIQFNSQIKPLLNEIYAQFIANFFDITNIPLYIMNIRCKSIVEGILWRKKYCCSICCIYPSQKTQNKLIHHQPQQLEMQKITEYQQMNDLDDQDEIIYCLISRGRTVILTEYTDRTGNFEIVTRLLLKHMPLENKIMSYVYPKEKYVFHYIVEDGLIYLCMANEGFPRMIAFRLLEDIKNKFIIQFREYNISTAFAYQFNVDFHGVLRSLMHSANDDKIRNTIYGTSDDNYKIGVMESIEKVLDRGEKIELLVHKSYSLDSTAIRFNRHCKRLKKRRGRFWELKGNKHESRKLIDNIFADLENMFYLLSSLVIMFEMRYNEYIINIFKFLVSFFIIYPLIIIICIVIILPSLFFLLIVRMNKVETTTKDLNIREIELEKET
eukprot:344618_1